jgi:hypothetical protein
MEKIRPQKIEVNLSLAALAPSFFERELTNFADALRCYWRQQNSLIRVQF